MNGFIPKFYNIEGQATGNLKLYGSLDKTKIEFNTKVSNAVFDRVFLGNINSKGLYKDNYLLVDYANSKNKDETITSYGRVPFDLNLSSEQFGQFFVNDSINYHSRASLSSMPFLSPYIPELDSIRGDIDIILSLTGPASAIMRDGSIEIKNSSVYTMLINNPLISVDGKADVIDNEMNINYLNGASLKQVQKNKLQNMDNIKVSGSIDFSSFFEPKYNLLVNSINKKNIHIDAIPIDLVGSVDSLDITITGRDTVAITGTIEAVGATLFHEFISEDIGTTLSNNDGVVFSYSLNIPIKDEGKFQNSQVDAMMIGEISISKTGNEFWNIGGEVYVDDGSILSFKDNFTGLNGYVTFDNNGINPNMDLMASTNIADEEIRLRITGDLDDADLILESSSGFSESDIIELLTFGARFEDRELSSTGFGVQATSVLGSLLETQFEKNLEEMSALKMLQPDEIDAVQIMTIHKAKGLAFNIVMIPFNWEDNSKKNKIWVNTGEYFEKLEQALINSSTSLNISYFTNDYINERELLLLDNLNKLYVAMTRPKDRLYLFCKNFPKNIDTKFEKKGYLNSFLYNFNKSYPITIGNPTRKKKTKGEKKYEDYTIDGQIKNNWKEKNSSKKTNSRKYKISEQSRDIEWGKILHLALSKIDCKEDINKVTETFLRNKDCDKAQYEKLKEQLPLLINNDRISKYINTDWEVKNEKEILLTSGKTYIPDKLIYKNNDIILIDYKTGEKKEEDKKQISNYADTLKVMGYNVIKTELIYTKEIIK